MPPITPHDARIKQAQSIPDEVYEVFNDLIAENYGNGRRVTIYQDAVIDRMRDAGINVNEAIDKHWLDVEPAYREAGWEVEYDGPGYNETFRAYYVFCAKS